ncbi:hypothetical protein M8C17_27890 [Micromonospora sp. RHAY321]|uniref:hypothetical protein n=1 Tax=Micromonospora sp. RHAY321 TaxID=2944807 RepID=UPI00207D59A2|nr:hypothetical protein [Micromonospora sp. RHAY321]MCO1598981.1 hypothetical protein [Micromonospora sp. RHAY321]
MTADRIDQKTAEQLFGGNIVDPSTARRPVALLLTAVRAAPSPGELAGEGVALHAFRRALADPAVTRQPDRRSRTLAWTGARAAVAALALAATGGVALAAVNGTTPRPHLPTATPPAPVGPPAATAPATGDRPATDAPATTVPTPHTSAVGEVVGLCRAYRTVAEGNPGRALDNPAFSGLIAAAGDRHRVADYCADILAVEAAPGRPTGARPGEVPSRHPGSPGPPDGPPTAREQDDTGPADGRSAPPGRPSN